MIKKGTIGKSVLCAAAFILSIVANSHAATVNVFLDDGNLVDGSSNTNWPYNHLDWDTTWDVGVSAENGLAAIGAAVMEVRLMALEDVYVRPVTQGGGNGLAVSGSTSGAWVDAGEGVIFQLKFYEDAAKSNEITGVNITFESITSRISLDTVDSYASNMAVNAFASDGAFIWEDVNTNSVKDWPDYYNLGGYYMFTHNDTNIAQTAELHLVAADAGVDSAFYTIDAAGSVIFGEGDTFWLRRENLNTSTNDLAYQIGALSFDVTRPVTVFFDDGTKVPDSSNAAAPFLQGDRDVIWNVTATAEPALALVGVAVMEVRMATIGTAFSRYATTGGGNGLGVAGLNNDAWLDPEEAALFEFKFYADAGKTTEITDLDIMFKAVTSRGWTPNQAVNAYASSRPFSWSTNVVDDNALAKMYNPALSVNYNMFSNNDTNVCDTSDLGLASAGTVGNGYWSTAYGADSVVFGPGDTFWLRRQNLAGQAVSAYQLGSVSFIITPTWQGLIALEKLAGTNAVAVSWGTTAGKNYRLESTTDLVGADWSTNTTVAGLGVSVAVTNATDQVQEFYRVVEE